MTEMLFQGRCRSNSMQTAGRGSNHTRAYATKKRKSRGCGGDFGAGRGANPAMYDRKKSARDADETEADGADEIDAYAAFLHAPYSISHVPYSYLTYILDILDILDIFKILLRIFFFFFISYC